MMRLAQPVVVALLIIGCVGSNPNTGNSRPAPLPGLPADPVVKPDPDRVGPLMDEVDASLHQKLEAYSKAQKTNPPSSQVEKTRRELLYMSGVDALLRKTVRLPIERKLSGKDLDEFNERLALRTLEVDRAHAGRVAEIIRAHGWPKITVYGGPTEGQAWVLIRRAADNLVLQREMLAVAEPLIANGEASSTAFAYLTDELRVAEGKPQRFGTQGECMGPSRWEPSEIEEPDSIEVRRAKFGLGTMDAQIQISQTDCP